MMNLKRGRPTNMDFILGIVVAISTVRWQIAEVGAYSLTNATDSVLGCSHNNTRFANGSFVPTVEPCLNCKCINANLICALRVCPEQTFPPPRGCVVVYKKQSCCPYMTCSKLHTAYKDQEKKVITHDRKWYEQNIRNRIFSQNALQRRIDDSEEEQQLGNGKMCVHNGTVYRSGSAMTTSSLCLYCYCIEGKQKCIQPKCTLPAKIGCEPISIDSSCCPIRYDCTVNKTIKARYNTKYNRRRNDNKHYLRMTSRMQRSRGCLVDSTFYPEGHKLPANQTNPCEICFCIGGTKRCAPKKCAPTIRNCKPIIPDGQCCASSYDCNTFSDHKTARGFTSSRQYSDIFSLLFGDEEKDNSTAASSSWDYESETEIDPIDSGLNATNEKGLLDAIKDSLNYVDGNKQSAEKQTNVPNQTIVPVSNLPSFNTSDNDENDNKGDEDDDDDGEEEISILDFFLKGESAFTSTTTKPFVFNITGKPLLNGMTNSPMQIQPILPDDIKNESIKFSMLPLSLYNMVKDDGSLMFDIDKTNQTPQVVLSHPLEPNATKDVESKTVVTKNGSASTESNRIAITTTTSVNTNKVSSTKAPTTTKPSKQTTTAASLKSTVVQEATANTKIKIHSTTAKLNKMESSIVKTTAFNYESTTKNLIELTTKITSTTAPTIIPNNVKVETSTTEKFITTTPLLRIPTILSKINAPSTKRPTTTTTTTSTKKPSPVESSTTISLQPLTTKAAQTTSPLPKITAVQINSNPSILETDMNYDYGEATLPPSLPNLKIIPFLPTDAVKNIIHKSDGYQPNLNFQSGPSSYVNDEIHAFENTAYSPFNIKPNAQKHPTYNGNVADDRIDYDTYKMPAEQLDSLDYINVYAHNSGNMVQPTSFQLNVNSKIDYDSDQKIAPSKVPVYSVNKNLTVKPPLPPFEPEHEYDLYNLPPQPSIHLQPANNYEYSVNSPTLNEPYTPEHNYNVPHFVTMPPISNSVFSYGNKNKFIPPAKTEGGFIPKRTHIPLHGTTNHVDNKFAQHSQNSMKNLSGIPSNVADPMENLKIHELNQTELIFDQHLISAAEYNEAFLGIGTSEEYDLSNDNVHNNSISLGNGSTNEILYSNEKKPPLTSVPLPAKESSVLETATTPQSTTHASTSKSPANNLTNNAIPLKLITILNNTKKESPTKVEIPQRKNNKIIDPTNEPLVEDMTFNVPSATTEMAPLSKNEAEKNENLTILRDAFLSSINHVPNGDLPEDLPHRPPLFLSRPINKFNFPILNSLESKHNFQANPIRSELDLIIPELNKNQQANDFSHTNNFSSENYQVLPADDTNIANTESYVINPVDVDKLKQHQSNSETKIFTPPHKDPAGLLKLSGCNIYGRMYRVGRIIAELSSSCLECRCTEVGVSCTPLNC